MYNYTKEDDVTMAAQTAASESNRELLKRIEELERRVARLELRDRRLK